VTPPEAGHDDGAGPPGFLEALLRRLVWRDVPSERGSGDGVILVSALVAFGIWLAGDRYEAGANARFYASGVTDVAWYGMGALALAWVARRAASGLPSLRPVVAGVVTALPVIVALSLAVGLAPAWAQLPGYAFVAILAAVQLRRILSRLGAAHVRRAMLASALFCLVFHRASSAAHVYANLWWEADDEDEGALSWSDSEDVLFDQPDRSTPPPGAWRRGARDSRTSSSWASRATGTRRSSPRS
jgi:hypothetical protein